MLFHITSRSQWQQAQQVGIYHCESLDTEGFIHCSTQDQVVSTANRFFQGQAGLVLLGIDPERLQAEIRYEPAEDQLFPHLYGPLNLDAITQIWQWSATSDGNFQLPTDLQKGSSAVGG